MEQLLVQASQSLGMLAPSAHWHGSPLPGVVTLCDGTRGNSGSKEHVCTSYGASGGRCSEELPWELGEQRKAR